MLSPQSAHMLAQNTFFLLKLTFHVQMSSGIKHAFVSFFFFVVVVLKPFRCSQTARCRAVGCAIEGAGVTVAPGEMDVARVKPP